MKREEITIKQKRKNEQALMEEFGSRQKSRWQSKRIIVNFNKAKAALDQLENRDIVVPPKNEDDAEGEDKEEEEITEEVCNLTIHTNFNF
jgi:hypothetical protein